MFSILQFRSFRYCRRPLLILCYVHVQASWQGKGDTSKAHLGMIKPILILSFCYSRLAFRGKLFPIEVGFAAREPYCSGRSMFKFFVLLDIQSFQATRYSMFVGFSIVFNLFGLLDIQTFQAARYSNVSGCSIFKFF